MLTRRHILGLMGGVGFAVAGPMGIGRSADVRRSLPMTAGRPLRMTFVNPGWENEDFWVGVSRLMRQAALRLGIDLRVLYANRSRTTYLQLVIEALQGTPDVMIAVNEEGVGAAVLELAEKAAIPVFMLLNTVPEDRIPPRTGYGCYLGALLSDNEQAGYVAARRLIQAARLRHPGKASLRMVAVDGVLATPAAADRSRGRDRALSEAPDVVLVDRVGGEWRQDLAQQRLTALARRNADLDMVWCANDPMALGALEALKGQGRIPGQDVVIGGFNGSPAIQAAIAEGTVELSMTGHVFAGALAMVMLREYADGRDFATPGGMIQAVPFGVLDRSALDRWQPRLNPANAGKLRFETFLRSTAEEPYRFIVDGEGIGMMPFGA